VRFNQIQQKLLQPLALDPGGKPDAMQVSRNIPGAVERTQ
jgi:hypothetical protein